jgi:hypothetical protein
MNTVTKTSKKCKTQTTLHRTIIILMLIVAHASAPALAQADATSTFEVGTQADVSNLGNLPRMQTMGMRWLKVQVFARNGVPNVAWILDWARKSKLKLLVSLLGEETLAGDRQYHPLFANFAAGVARQGVDAIEVWNEPNLDTQFKPGVNPEAYAHMLTTVYAAVKQANPNILVISGGLAAYQDINGCRSDICDSDRFLLRMAAAGGLKSLDCVGIHWNIGHQSPTALSGSVFKGRFAPYLGPLVQAMSIYAKGKPLCFTELGFASGEGVGGLPDTFGWARQTTLAQQATWLGQAIPLLADTGKVRLMIVWNLDLRVEGDDPQIAYAIIRPDGTCPACRVIQQAISILRSK